MKDSVLRVMLDIYKESSSTLPPLEFEFLLTSNKIKDRLPIIKKEFGSHLVDIVKHLESEKMIISHELKFYFTEDGLRKARELSETPKNTEKLKSKNWQDNLVLYMIVGVFIVVIGGIINKYVF